MSDVSVNTALIIILSSFNKLIRKLHNEYRTSKNQTVNFFFKRESTEIKWRLRKTSPIEINVL